MTNNTEINQFEDLLTRLEDQHLMLNRAQDPDAGWDFESENEVFPEFKQSIIANTSFLLGSIKNSHINYDVYMARLYNVIDHSLKTCVLDFKVPEPADRERDDNDFERLQYLHRYTRFLVDLHFILQQYTATRSVIDETMQDLPKLISDEDLEPILAVAEGIEVQSVGGTKKNRIGELFEKSSFVLNILEWLGELKAIATGAKAVYRIGLYCLYQERYGKKFYDSLTLEGRDTLVAEFLGCDMRYYQMIRNDENTSRNTGPRHRDKAKAFLEKLRDLKE